MNLVTIETKKDSKVILEMFNRIVRQIFLFIVIGLLFMVSPQKINASTQIWSLNSTTDCSGQGGDGNIFSNLCYNLEGVNSTISWMHSDDPSIHFEVVVGHQYTFSETTSFTGIGGNFISNYLTDGNGYDYGLGSDWICPTPGCAHGSWTKTFEAKSPDLYFLQASACSSSTDCYTSNITLIDLSQPAIPSTTPQVIWSLPSTSDCSHNGTANSPCYNTNGVNDTVSWIHSNDPAISIQVVPGHTYEFTEGTPFAGIGDDFISNYLTDGNGYDYGLGSDWICPTPGCAHGSWTKTFTALSDKILFSQGSDCSSSSSCFTTDLRLTDLSEPEPLPSPPPSPAPVSKVIFAPGFGGSWNTAAFVNCTPDPEPSHWSLASYAEGVYNPLLDALSGAGWNVKPFYYDWRDLLNSNSNSLNDVVNNFAPGDEKVNIVGHSMGGLVATDYLQNNGGTKTSQLLTVGSPLKGVVQSYPAWSGGDILNDNFITKVAINLYLRRCGGLLSNRVVIQNQIPSVQNLLPVFNYLKKGNTLKPWGTMIAKNNWSLTIPNNFWGVKFGTLTGTGFSTLTEIPVKDPSSKDISASNWLDGKPSGKTMSTNGDGTVLLSSSKYDEAHNITINQNHAGLVNSIPGMTEILSFLGTPPTSSLVQGPSEPNSALILIGYPANFWVTDENGNTKKDNDGMLAFNNPKSGVYKLNILPKTTNTLFIVAQFLPNGQVFYKEYNFTNLLPKLKTLRFDTNNPKANILN